MNIGNLNDIIPDLYHQLAPNDESCVEGPASNNQNEKNTALFHCTIEVIL